MPHVLPARKGAVLHTHTHTQRTQPILLCAASARLSCLQVGVCDAQHVFVHWTCHGTNLRPTQDNAGRPHKPTFHESHVAGIDFFTFSEDRSRLQEVVIYRCGRQGQYVGWALPPCAQAGPAVAPPAPAAACSCCPASSGQPLLQVVNLSRPLCAVLLCGAAGRRQPTLEEREALEMEALEQDRLAIKLERLHFDGRS